MCAYRESLNFTLLPPTLSMFITLLLLIFGDSGIRQVNSALTNYGDVLENQQIDNQLRLLGPEGLLRNRRQNSVDANNTSNCARDLAIYERAIDQRESWALKMLDASSKLPVGMLQGHVIDMGMFDECMDAARDGDGIQSTDLQQQIHGRHCMYAINQSNNKKRFILNPTLSICLPASCDAENVMGLLHDTINATKMLRILGINVVSASCSAALQSSKNYNDNEQTKSSNTIFVISFTIAVVYISFLVFCTLCDLLARRRSRRRVEKNSSAVSDAEDVGIFSTLERFSLLKSAEKILDTTTTITTSGTRRKDGTDFGVIHGIRAISTCWIVLVHEYLVQLLGVNVNVVYITKWFSSWGSMYPLMGIFSVDTFLAVSGFLMTWNFFKRQTAADSHNFNVALYYLHRFIRLTFPVLALIVATFVLLPGLGASGPRYDWLQNIFLTGCGRKWWSVLFYFQNFIETDNYCLLHLWSLSVDMQLYWLSPLVLLPLFSKQGRKFGLAILIILILTSAILSGWIVGANKYSSIYVSHDYNITRVMEAFQKVYQMTYTRASPWLIGILFAYIVSIEQQQQQQYVRPNKALFFTIGWLMAIGSFLFCTLGTRSFTHANYEYNLAREVTFATLQRPLWAFGICWIIYASIHNAAGPIASLLSAKLFLPISRISYSIYLVHIILPVFQVGTSRTAKYFNQYSILQSYISDMVMAIVLGFFFSIIFEVPVLILEDMMFKRRQKNSTREQLLSMQKTK